MRNQEDLKLEGGSSDEDNAPKEQRRNRRFDMSDSSSLIQNHNLGITRKLRLKTNQESCEFSYDYFDAIVHSMAWCFIKSKSTVVTDAKNYNQRGAKLIRDLSKFEND